MLALRLFVARAPNKRGEQVLSGRNLGMGMVGDGWGWGGHLSWTAPLALQSGRHGFQQAFNGFHGIL